MVELVQGHAPDLIAMLASALPESFSELAMSDGAAQALAKLQALCRIAIANRDLATIEASGALRSGAGEDAGKPDPTAGAAGTPPASTTPPGDGDDKSGTKPKGKGK